MSANLPAVLEPMTPPDCDLRPYRTMPLDVQRLRDSMIASHENPEVFRAAVLLWCAAWHQIPAASLPNDDRELAKMAGFGRFVDQWREIRDDALKGFVLCSDGRLYHRVIAEMALPAWQTRQRFIARSKKGNQARYGASKSQNDNGKLLEGADKDASSDANGTERNGTEEGKKKTSSAKRPSKKPARSKSSPAEDTQRGTRMPIGWFAGPKEREYARNLGFDDTAIDAIEEGFRLWWPAQPGAKGRKVDWSLTWMTWVRKEKERRDEREKRTGAGRGGARSTDSLGELHAGFMAHSQRRPERP